MPFRKRAVLSERGSYACKHEEVGHSFDKAADRCERGKGSHRGLAWQSNSCWKNGMCMTRHWNKFKSCTHQLCPPLISFFMSHCLNTHCFQLIPSVLTEISSLLRCCAVELTAMMAVFCVHAVQYGNCRWLLSTWNGTSVTEELIFY